MVAVQRKLLVIADIGGYTRYMLATRASLAHAQIAVTGLLEAVLDGASTLTLQKLEGDAAFFAGEPGVDVSADIAAMRARFHARRAALVAERMCDCAGCMHLEDLTLKFVAHAGEVAVHKVRNLEELAGVDVILVHRMLKNDVPEREYLLVTDAALATLDQPLQSTAQRLEHDFEGIGVTATHWLPASSFDGRAPPAAPAKALSGFARLAKKVAHELRSLPYMLKLKTPMPMKLDDEA